MCDPHRQRYSRGWRGAKLLAPVNRRRFVDIKQVIAEYQQPVQASVAKPPEEGLSYDADWKRFSEWLGIVRERKAKVPAASFGKRRRTAVISDLHVPFHNIDAITEAIETCKSLEVDKLVIGGDFLDCYALSSFSKYENVAIIHEVTEARKLLDWWSREFSEVDIIAGNHEDRERKHFAKKLTVDEQEWLLDRCILDRVSADMPNVKIVKRHIQKLELGWIAAIGEDAIVGHPTRSSKIPLRPVDWFREWLLNWEDVLGINRPRLVVQGHTHQAGMAWVGNTMIVENGCLCRFQGYALSPDLYSRPQRLAYTVFDQVDGYTDMNSVRQFYPFANHRRKAS